jgi:hypothetical protein
MENLVHNSNNEQHTLTLGSMSATSFAAVREMNTSQNVKSSFQIKFPNIHSTANSPVPSPTLNNGNSGFSTNDLAKLAQDINRFKLYK